MFDADDQLIECVAWMISLLRPPQNENVDSEDEEFEPSMECIDDVQVTMLVCDVI